MRVRIKGDIAKDLMAAVEAQKVKKMHKMVDALQTATPVDTGYAESRWRVEGSAIVNDADYIDDLNKGHSEQAPAYFIEETLLTQKGVRPSGTIVRPK